jgi:hypothetical protein
MIGESVVDEADDTVGKVGDIIIVTDGKAPSAVLSVGGWPPRRYFVAGVTGSGSPSHCGHRPLRA